MPEFSLKQIYEAATESKLAGFDKFDTDNDNDEDTSIHNALNRIFFSEKNLGIA